MLSNRNIAFPFILNLYDYNESILEMLQVFNVRIVLKSTRGLFSKKIIPTKLNSGDLTAMEKFLKIEATLQMRGHLEQVNSDMKGWDGYTQTSRNYINDLKG